MTQRIAYIHSRLRLNDARLKFMPFGLSAVQMLDRQGHHVDLYLAEERNEGYRDLFSERVRCFFLDSKPVWERPGKLNYWLLKWYFRYLLWNHRTRYDAVFSSGQAGNVLGHLLAENQGCPFIFLSDEFPDIYGIPIWKDAEAEAARAADIIVVPDEVRFEKLCEQVPGLENKAWATLPNAPLLADLENLPQIDWHQRLGLPEGSKIFLAAGGIYDFNQIAETMFSVPDWPEEAVLLINGKESPYNPASSYAHLDLPGRIFWHKELYDDPEFHSLVKASTASFGLYRDQADLPYVGKSSGKILRSLACGRPVIASDFFSLNFVTELGVGVQVRHPREISRAVVKLLADEESYAGRCQRVYYDKLSFESYWPSLSESMATRHSFL